MELFLGYLAGILTLINPCVLPVLPIVVATSLNASRWGPLALAAGMSVTFVAVGLGVTTLGYSLGIDDRTVAKSGAVLMLLFGAVLLVPRFSAAFSAATAGLGAAADARLEDVDRSSLNGQVLSGALLGAVWSPCVGPTLGGAIAMASQGESLLRAGAIMASFAAGVSTIILALGYGAQSVIRRRQEWMRALARRSRPIMGIVFLLVGLMILSDTDKRLEGALLDAMPAWLIDFSVTL